MLTSRLFGVGIGGAVLTADERHLLQRHPPRAVILFRRNLETVEQVRALARDLSALEGKPLVCVDQEGGPVDRFRDLLGPAISLRRAAQRDITREAGRLAGESCARLGFDVDLAPVIDRLLPGTSERILAERAASADPESVSRAAREFLDGLTDWGIGACVKHFPGLGRADLDTHKALPRIPDDPTQEERDLAPFAATMDRAGAVMISHAAGPDGVPASLSRDKAHGLLRERLGFSGAAFSDDLEMGALASFGDLPQRCALAARAGCDLLFVCSRIDLYEECVAAVESEVPEQRRAQAAARLDAYAERLDRTRANARVSERPIDELIAAIDELRESGQQT